MRKIWLRMKEQNNYERIKRYVDQGGDFKRICLELDISERTGRRMVAGYKKQGKAYFLHGNRGRSPATKLKEEHREEILQLYEDPLYEGANFKHFHELLQRRHTHIPKISLSTLRNLFKEADILSPKARRATRKAYHKRQKERIKSLSQSTPEVPQSLALPVDPSPHPRREKSKYSGELLFMDASQHDWLEEDKKIHLHAVIDDKTGAVLGAYFTEQETLQGYYRVLEQVLRTYGIPFKIQTDGRSIFEFAAFKHPKREDTFTQFAYACKTLGIQLHTTPSAQAQGKIERLFQTLQSRLIVELRLQNMKTIKEANEFLHAYLPQYNEQFATSHPHDTTHVFEEKPSDEEINLTLAVLDERIIDGGNCIRFENNYYRLLDHEAKQVYLRPKSKVLVIKALDARLYATHGETVFALEKLELFKEHSWNFDSEHEKKPRSLTIPPMSHPWKKENFVKHKKKVWENIYGLDWKSNYSWKDLCYTTERLFG